MNFYPFGLKHKGYNNVVSSNGNSVANRFGFGGKELSEELGLNWHDFSARNYDASLGRWMNLDPLAEQMRRHSPYNFAFNNPIYFQDYDGMAPEGPGDGLWDKLKKGVKRLLGGVKSNVSENLNVSREKKINSGDNIESGKVIEERKEVKQEATKEIMAGSVDTTIAGLDIVDAGADAVATGANAITVATGGASLPITGPVAAAAEGVSLTAKGAKASIYYSGGDNTKGNAEIKSIAVSAVTSVVSAKLVKRISKTQELTKVQGKVTQSAFSLTLGYWRKSFLGF
tara:strand:- start:5558 stop:6412 length:855 start_codon:yes stop_codon:yes gene_type:complete